MSRKSLIRPLAGLEQREHPEQVKFVWNRWLSQYSLEGEEMDETAFQAWRQQQPNTKMDVRLWNTGFPETNDETDG